MLQVADRVHAVLHIDRLVRHHLNILSLQQAFRFFRDHVGDARLAGGEVVAQLFHLVVLSALGHFRLSDPFTAQRVQLAPRKDRIGLHVVLDVIRGQLHVLIGDRRTAIVVYFPLAAGEIRNDGVLGGREGRTLQGTFFQKVQGIPAGDGVCPVKRVQPGRKEHGVQLLLIQAVHLHSPASKSHGRASGSQACYQEKGREILQKFP